MVIEEIRKMVYEKYTCHIQNVQLVLSDSENWNKDIEKLDTDRHILCPFEIMFDIHRSIVPQDVHFKKIILSGRHTLLIVNITEINVSIFLCRRNSQD